MCTALQRRFAALRRVEARVERVTVSGEGDLHTMHNNHLRPASPPRSLGACPFALDDRYLCLRRIGRGGMGDVYAGIDVVSQRRVAIKIPHACDRGDAHRLLGEYHYNCVVSAAADPVIRASVPTPMAFHSNAYSLPCIVMELLDGVTCEERLAESGTFHSAEALRVVRDVALTTSYANERGYVHRDVKPSNVMLTRGGATPRVVLLDPGCARLPEARLTLRGAPHFTPGVAPPEVIRALPTDERTDVFMLAALLLRLTTDHDPFEGVDARTTIETSLAATRPPPLDAFEASIAGAFAPATPAIRRADTLRMAPPPPVVRSLVEVLRDALEPEIAARPSHSELIEVIEDVLTALTPLGELRRAC